MNAAQKVKTSGIDHIHLNVNRIEDAIERFTGLFDCSHNIPLYIDSIDGINSMNSLGVDVIAPASEDGFYARFVRKMGGEGLSTVSFLVDDIDEATRRIEGQGLVAVSKVGYPGIERQTQFHASDCYGMSIELVYLYPDAEEKIAKIKAEQAKDNDGATAIPAKENAVPASGIDHVRLRVDDVERAITHFKRLFECQWSVSEDGLAARSSLGVHLLQSDDGKQGIDGFAIRVDDLAAAATRAELLGMRVEKTPAYLADDKCVCFSPEDCFGVSLVLIEAT